MIRFLRALRLVLRFCIVGILILTALSAWQYSPISAKEIAEMSTFAPPRQNSSGFVQLVTQYLSGGPATMSIAGFEIMDPLLGLISTFSVPSSIGSVAPAILIPIILTLCFGRVFCGYICPVGWLSTIHFRLRKRLTKPKAKPTRADAGVIGLLFLVFILSLALAGAPSFMSLTLVHLHVQQLATYIADSSALWTAVGGIAAFVVVDIFIAPGLWCHSLCPSGSLYSLLATKRLLGVKKTVLKKCPEHCFRCNEHCWIHLEPRNGNAGPSCDMCLSCVKQCPQKKLGVGLVRKPTHKSMVLLLVLTATALITTIVYSHRISAQGLYDLPRLDSNPPWSTSINRLDGEVWVRQEKINGGLSVSFVEHTEAGDLYLFSTALLPENRDEADFGQVEVQVTSNGRTASLRMNEPNAPRSTSNKSIYSGRVFVDSKTCNSLRVTFPNRNFSMEMIFPKSCRTSALSQFLFGFVVWAGMLGILVGLLVYLTSS